MTTREAIFLAASKSAVESGADMSSTSLQDALVPEESEDVVDRDGDDRELVAKKRIERRDTRIRYLEDRVRLLEAYIRERASFRRAFRALQQQQDEPRTRTPTTAAAFCWPRSPSWPRSPPPRDDGIRVSRAQSVFELRFSDLVDLV